jgi:general stress protein YciG
MADKRKGGMTVSEAGRRGGEKTSETHGHEFYEAIGKMGGHKGGETTSERHGHGFYEEIGHKGGQKVKHLVEEGKKAQGE